MFRSQVRNKASVRERPCPESGLELGSLDSRTRLSLPLEGENQLALDPGLPLTLSRLLNLLKGLPDCMKTTDHSSTSLLVSCGDESACGHLAHALLSVHHSYSLLQCRFSEAPGDLRGCWVPGRRGCLRSTSLLRPVLL